MFYPRKSTTINQRLLRANSFMNSSITIILAKKLNEITEIPLGTLYSHPEVLLVSLICDLWKVATSCEMVSGSCYIFNVISQFL